ncbi:MAG: leucine-rich repeat protein [Clostridia bacterium]|nr:leucine-rich repeat protein [Clostridia bacterium]
MSLDLFQMECQNCGAIMDRDNAVRGVLRCEYCRRSYVLPKEDQVSEVLVELELGKTNLNACAFTKAYGAYAKAVELDPSEPEGYFGMALAENKIQYLKDVVLDKLTPVRYERSGGKFSENAHYKKAVSLATKEQASVYKEYAKEIDEVFAEFEKLYSAGAEYDCYLGAPADDKCEEQKVVSELYERLKTDGYKPFSSREEKKRFPKFSSSVLELFALVSAKCFVTVCFDEGKLKNKEFRNSYSRFIDVNKSVRKPKNNLTVLFKDKPVEQIPGIYGKLQGIRYGDAFAYRDLTRYVDVMLGRVKPATEGMNKRKIGAIAAAAAVLVIGGTVTGIVLGTQNDNGTQGGGTKPAEFVYTENGTDGYKLSSVVLNGNTTLVLPGEYNGLPVTAIGEAALSGCSDLTKLTLPDCLLSIGDNAFSNCSKLSEIVLPQNLVQIGDNAFSGCSSLSEIVLPSSLTNLGDGAFNGCTSLTSFVLPQTLSALGGGVFSGCSSLESLNVDFGLVDYTFGGFFGTEYFSGSTAVYQRNTAYYLPDSLKTVTVTGEDLPFGAFQNCAKLTAVHFTGEVSAIPNNAFQGCSALTGLTLPQTLTEVGIGAFKDCSSLEQIQLSELVATVGNEAFMNCSSLASASILNDSVTIGEDVFYGCTELKTLTAPCNMKKLAEYFGRESIPQTTPIEFETVTYYVPALEKVTLIGEKIVEKGVYGFVNLKEANLSSDLTEIGEQAFLNCVSLQGVDFTHVTSIGDKAFEDCTSITQIELPTTIQNYGAEIFKGCSEIENLTFSFFNGNDTFGNLFEKTQATGSPEPAPISESEITYVSIQRENGAYALPVSLSNVSVIGNVLPVGAFENCSFIDKVNLGSEISSILARTFYGCTELTNFTAETKITSIGYEAFYECESLVDYPLSESATLLGYSAFYGCKALKEIFIPTAITYVSNSTFQNCTALEKASVEHVLDFSASAFEGCTSLTDVKISSAQSLSENAFKDCSAIKNLEIPSTVVLLSSTALEGLTGLQSLVWSVEELNNSYTESYCAFNGIASATDGAVVTFSENVTKIPNYLFPTEANIKKIILAGENLSSVGSGVFRSFTHLTEVSIASVDAWFKIAFASETSNPLSDGVSLTVNGNAVTEITMPSDVTKIGQYQFKGFTGLKSFIFHENLQTIEDNAFSGCTGIEKIDVGSIENWAGLDFAYTYRYRHPYEESKGELYEKGVLIKELVLNTETVSSQAFRNMSLTSITIGSGVKNLQEFAFYSNEYVEKIYWNAPLASVAANAFSLVGKSVSSGVEVTIGPDVAIVQSKLFSMVSSVTKIVFEPNDVLWKIDSGAFQNAKITEFTIPAAVTVINDSAFENCVNLTSIEIPETVTSISTNAFGNCTALESILWKATNSAQNVKIFNGSGSQNGLTVTLGENVTKIPAFFTYGAKVTKLVIPESTALESIGNYALAGAAFTSFTVPETVTDIGNGVFQNCSSLTELTLPFFGSWSGDTSSSTTKLTNLFYGAEPKSFKKLTVTSDDVPASAFYGALRVEEVVLLKDDLTIGRSAFEHVDSIKKVICSGDVLLIDQSAFNDCSGLQSFEAAGELTDVGMDAFRLAVALKSVSATQIGSIGQESFYGCKALTELPKFVASSYVGNSSFTNCTGGLNIRADSFADWCAVGHMLDSSNPLSKENASLYIDGKLVETAELTDVEIINQYAFSSYVKLTKVVLGESVTQVGKGAFLNCTNLAEIETHCKAEYLENSFSNILATAQVNILNLRGWCESTFVNNQANPASLQGNYLVDGETLVNLEIPEGTNAINAYAFYNGHTIKTLKVPTTIASCGVSAFYKCNLTDIVWNARACADFSKVKEGSTMLTAVEVFDSTSAQEWGKLSITIGEDVEILPAYLFYNIWRCNELKITAFTFLAKNCKKVGNDMFDWNFSYRTQQIGYVDIADINAWSQIEFGLNSANPTEFTNELRINGEKVGAEIVLDDSFTRIGSATFTDFDRFGVTKIHTPTALEEIGACAFEYCNLFTDISIPDTIKKIGGSAFLNCSNATFNGGTTLNFLRNLTELGSSAFSGCGKITELVVPNNPNLDYTASSMFSSFAVENITVEDGVQTLGEYMFYNCKVSGTLTIPSSVTTVGRYILSGATVGKLAWNVNVTGERTLSDTILAGATITNLQIGKNVTALPDFFTGGNDEENDRSASASITNVIFEEDSVCERIGHYAFYESGVKTCNFPASLKYIGDSAFYYTPLQQCVFSEGLEHIGQFAFDWCKQLTSVSIPTTLTYYGARAFSNCEKITYVYWNAEACADIEHIQYEYSTGYCNPFAGISTEATFVIGNKVKIVPAYLCFQTNAKEIIFEENSICEEIHSYAFSGTSKATTLSLPASLKLIERYGIGYFDRCSFTDIFFEGDGNWQTSWTTTEIISGKVVEVPHYATLTADMLTDSKQNFKYFTNYASSSPRGYGNCVWTKI